MNILVCCSSRTPNNRIYDETEEAIISIEKYIVDKGHNLVIGGKITWLHKKLYTEVKKGQNSSNSHIYIYTIQQLIKTLPNNLDYCEVCETSIKMKEKMMKKADVIVFLPGDLETIADFVYMFKAKLNKEHDKELILYNASGYYDKLLEMFDETEVFNFEEAKPWMSYIYAENIKTLITILQNS